MGKSVIVGAARTPVGKLAGVLSSIPATKLGSIAIAEAIRRAGVPPDKVDQAIMGNVLPAGTGQAPARQATLGAGLPNTVGAITINKVCGSGLESVMLADSIIRAGDAKIIVAGGMESMSNAPYLLEKARTGYRMGHAELIDSMIKDGLWDAYNNFHMGSAADKCAREKGFSREEQDSFALESFRRALEAQKEGRFKAEIVPVPVPQKKGEPTLVTEDEGPASAPLDKLRGLKPAFNKDGTVTAGNASGINDGGAAFVVADEDLAKQMGWKPLARIVSHAVNAHAPEWFTTAPAGACRKALEKAGLTVGSIDLYEVNEAFAVVTLVTCRELGIDLAKVNVNGGAVAIGHPIGASGARVLTTLLYAMQARGAKRGLATLCIGGGEGVALVVERP